MHGGVFQQWTRRQQLQEAPTRPLGAAAVEPAAAAVTAAAAAAAATARPLRCWQGSTAVKKTMAIMWVAHTLFRWPWALGPPIL